MIIWCLETNKLYEKLKLGIQVFSRWVCTQFIDNFRNFSSIRFIKLHVHILIMFTKLQVSLVFYCFSFPSWTHLLFTMYVIHINHSCNIAYVTFNVQILNFSYLHSSNITFDLIYSHNFYFISSYCISNQIYHSKLFQIFILFLSYG